MGFLNTFIELSILDETMAQSSELEYHSRLLERQRELIREQNDGINALVSHNEKQDWCRDYMYRINKLCERLEKSPEKKSIEHYYAVYCLAKGVNESGLSASDISEVRDKEYFDDCLDRIGRLIFDSAQQNKDKLNEYNVHIKHFEEQLILSELKSKLENEKENERRINDHGKAFMAKIKGAFVGFLPFGIVACVGMKIGTKADYSPFLAFGGLFCGLVAGYIGGGIGRKCAVRKQKNPLTESQYDKLVMERKERGQSISNFAKLIFPDFYHYEYTNISENKNLWSLISAKEKEIALSLSLLHQSQGDIYETFCVRR